MKKFVLLLLSLVMAAALVLGFTACDGGKDDPEVTPIDVAGEYSIDLSEAGMPMTVYLQIKDDGAFMFAPDMEFAASKSDGTVSKLSDGGYMMLFANVDGEAAASGTTCNFTKESDGSLEFNGKIPYGSANFSSPMTNDDGEEVVIVAVPATGEVEGNDNTVEAGLYYGTYTTEGMMQTTYEYYLTIREDNKFTAFVVYAMGESTYFGYDYGECSAMGSACRMTSTVYDDPETEEDLTEALTVDENGVYTADVQMSRMAKDTVKVTVEKIDAAPAEPVASYEGTHSVQMGAMATEFALTLDIYADGSYEFTASSSMGDPSTETGFIGIETAMTGKGILLPEGMATPADISVDTETGAISGKFSMGAGDRQDVTLTPVAA